LFLLACRVWIRHDAPTYIELHASQIIDQLALGGHMEPMTCDVFLRCFTQDDQQMYGVKGNALRQFLESDFAVGRRLRFDKTKIKHIQLHFDALIVFLPQMRVLGDENYLSSRSIRKQFAGPHVPGDK
jgi:hypothetical protein